MLTSSFLHKCDHKMCPLSPLNLFQPNSLGKLCDSCCQKVGVSLTTYKAIKKTWVFMILNPLQALVQNEKHSFARIGHSFHYECSQNILGIFDKWLWLNLTQEVFFMQNQLMLARKYLFFFPSLFKILLLLKVPYHMILS